MYLPSTKTHCSLTTRLDVDSNPLKLQIGKHLHFDHVNRLYPCKGKNEIKIGDGTKTYVLLHHLKHEKNSNAESKSINHKKFHAKGTLEFHASFYFFPTNHSRF